MTRALQNRLALANVKIKHGWENLSIDTIEPKIEMELKRKRPGSSNDALSDASSISDRIFPPHTFDSSPIGGLLFSDDLGRSGGSVSQSKRARYSQQPRYPASSNHSRVRHRSSAGVAKSWKAQYRLPESSPVYSRNRHVRYPMSHGHTLSFISETSTVPDDAPSPLLSEDDDEDLPLHSFQIASSTIRSSPPMRSPRTPPPALARSARLKQDGFNAVARSRTGEEDANLLMYLATSPSPAQKSSKHLFIAPQTPPSKTTPLPSSMMSTPGGGQIGGELGFPNFVMNTPHNPINFSEFLNMSPSPAQPSASWSRTPIDSKTPIAAREARRRLNFDTLLPPSSLLPKQENPTGLGMDLGEALMS